MHPRCSRWNLNLSCALRKGRAATAIKGMTMTNSASNWFRLGFFLLISVGGGLYVGATNLPGDWYLALQKPPFTPPGWLFAPAWTFLYCLIGIAGARIMENPSAHLLLPIWVGQMVLNFIWSPAVFTLHNLELGLAIILALLLFIGGFIYLARRRDPIASMLFVPYLLWVTFATYLNLGLVLLN